MNSRLEKIASDCAEATLRGFVEPLTAGVVENKYSDVMGSIDIKPQKCGECGCEAVQATSLSGHHTPRTGDPNICIGCGHLTLFQADGTVREPTVGELTGMLRDPKITRIRDRIREGLHKEEVEFEVSRDAIDAAKRIAKRDGRELDDVITDSIEAYSAKVREERDLNLDARLSFKAPPPAIHSIEQARLRTEVLLDKRGYLDDKMNHLRRLNTEHVLVEDAIMDMLEKDGAPPTAETVKALREMMAESLARKDGCSIEDARAQITLLEQIREGLESKGGERAGFDLAKERKRPEPPDFPWPHVNLPRNDEMYDDRMRELPLFHISAAMESDLSVSDGWKFAETYAYWPPFPEFGIQVDPHADKFGLHVMFDSEREHDGAFAWLPDGIHVSISPSVYQSRVGKAEGLRVAAATKRVTDRFGELHGGEIKMGTPAADSWMVTIRGRMFWYEDIPGPEYPGSHIRAVGKTAEPTAVGPSITLTAFWNPGEPVLFPLALDNVDAPEFMIRCLQNVAQRYVAVALNFVLLLNNRDAVRKRINQPTDGMNRQQRRAWERAENKAAREEWQVRVKPQRDLVALVRESVACENVERKLPGRHRVRAHKREYKSGKVVLIESFEKCVERPWAHLERKDAPEYDAWSLEANG